MKVKVLVGGVTPDVWFRGTKDERQVMMLNCLDRDAFQGVKLKQTFDYQPSREEQAEIDLEKLDGLEVEIAVQEIKASNGGRLKMLGKIDRRTVPDGAHQANGKPTPAPAAPKKG